MALCSKSLRAQLRHVDSVMMILNRKGDLQLIECRSTFGCCRGLHTITKTSKPLRMFICLIWSRKIFCEQNDCNFQCEINNKAAAAQSFIRPGGGQYGSNCHVNRTGTFSKQVFLLRSCTAVAGHSSALGDWCKTETTAKWYNERICKKISFLGNFCSWKETKF